MTNNPFATAFEDSNTANDEINPFAAAFESGEQSAAEGEANAQTNDQLMQSAEGGVAPQGTPGTVVTSPAPVPRPRANFDAGKKRGWFENQQDAVITDPKMQLARFASRFFPSAVENIWDVISILQPVSFDEAKNEMTLSVDGVSVAPNVQLLLRLLGELGVQIVGSGMSEKEAVHRINEELMLSAGGDLAPRGVARYAARPLPVPRGDDKPPEKKETPLLDAVIDFYKRNYGFGAEDKTWDYNAFGRFLREDSWGFISDALSIVSLGGASALKGAATTSKAIGAGMKALGGRKLALRFDKYAKVTDDLNSALNKGFSIAPGEGGQVRRAIYRAAENKVLKAAWNVQEDMPGTRRFGVGATELFDPGQLALTYAFRRSAELAKHLKGPLRRRVDDNLERLAKQHLVDDSGNPVELPASALTGLKQTAEAEAVALDLGEVKAVERLDKAVEAVDRFARRIADQVLDIRDPVIAKRKGSSGLREVVRRLGNAKDELLAQWSRETEKMAPVMEPVLEVIDELEAEVKALSMSREKALPPEIRDIIEEVRKHVEKRGDERGGTTRVTRKQIEEWDRDENKFYRISSRSNQGAEASFAAKESKGIDAEIRQSLSEEFRDFEPSVSYSDFDRQRETWDISTEEGVKTQEYYKRYEEEAYHRGLEPTEPFHAAMKADPERFDKLSGAFRYPGVNGLPTLDELRQYQRKEDWIETRRSWAEKKGDPDQDQVVFVVRGESIGETKPGDGDVIVPEKYEAILDADILMNPSYRYADDIDADLYGYNSLKRTKARLFDIVYDQPRAAIDAKQLRQYQKLHDAFGRAMDETIIMARPDLEPLIRETNAFGVETIDEINSAWGRKIQQAAGEVRRRRKEGGGDAWDDPEKLDDVDSAPDAATDDKVRGPAEQTEAAEKLLQEVFELTTDLDQISSLYESVGGFNSETGKAMRSVWARYLTERARRETGPIQMRQGKTEAAPRDKAWIPTRLRRELDRIGNDRLRAYFGNETAQSLNDLADLLHSLDELAQKSQGSGVEFLLDAIASGSGVDKTVRVYGELVTAGGSERQFDGALLSGLQRLTGRERVAKFVASEMGQRYLTLDWDRFAALRHIKRMQNMEHSAVWGRTNRLAERGYQELKRKYDKPKSGINPFD